MGKNLCPENEITFETSYQVKFETPIPPGTYTCSAVIDSTYVDSSACLMLFYYSDSTTEEVYITREPEVRVFKITELTKEATRVRIYASEGYSMSSGDTATYSMLQIEAGDQMTAYEPYGYEPEPEPEPEDSKKHKAEINLYYAALSGAISVGMLPKPSCRETMLIRKLLKPSYELPIFLFDSRIEMYLLDLIHGTTTMLTNVPKLDKEKYLHKAIGGMVEEMPNPNACEVNYWMNEWISNKGV